MSRSYFFSYGNIAGALDCNPADTLLRPELGARPADNAALRDLSNDLRPGEQTSLVVDGVRLRIERTA